MPDPFSPDWLGQSAPWSYWPSSLLGFARQDARERADGTQPPDDPWNQSAAQWWQPPVGANGASVAPIARQDARERAGGTPNDAWDRTTPVWLRSAMPPLSNGGLPGAFAQADAAAGQDNSAAPPFGTFPGAGRGILAPLDRWNDPQSSGAGGGADGAPLGALSSAGTQTAPAWLPSALPFAGPLPIAGSGGAQGAFATPSAPTYSSASFAPSYPFAQSWPLPPAEQTNAAAAEPPAAAPADIPDQLDTSAATAFTRRDRRRLPMQPVPEGAALDTLKSVGVGVGEKLIGLAGLPGLAQEGARWLGEKIADRLPERNVGDQARLEAAFNAPFAPGALTQAREDAYNNTLRLMGVPRLPTPADIKGTIEQVTGPFYQPRTPDGEFAQKLSGHMLDAAGPGGVLRKAAQAVIPEVANDIADKLTKGTDSETWAPTAAGIAASLLAGWSPRGVPRTPPESTPLALPAPPRQLLLPPPAERPLLPAPEPRLALPPSRYKDPKPSWDGPIVSDVAPPGGLTAYRVFGGGSGGAGRWLSLTKPTSAGAAIRDLALQPDNTAEYYSIVHIPAGTRYQSGTAAPNWGRPGGGQQIELFENLPVKNYGPGILLPP